MSSVTKRPNGHRWVQFSYQGKRHTLRLGKVPESIAKSFSVMLDKLCDFAAYSYPLDSVTKQWIESLPDRQREAIARIGLIEGRKMMTVAELVDIRLADKSLQDSTRASYGQVRRCLKEFFAEIPLQDIQRGNCDAFRDWLAEQVSDATVAKRCSMARSFFNEAVRAGVIESNPWEGQKLPESDNDRQRFISAEQIDRILDHLQDANLRTAIVFARYGGLRCPSEFRPLRWEHIDWDRNKILIHAPKTKRYKHKATRFIPIFPAIREQLDELPRDHDVVFHWMHQVGDTAIRKQLTVAIERAGLVPWPKPWQNLRASAATWMTREFGPVLASRWCGHSVKIADTHYWMVRDSDYENAASKGEAKSEAVEIQC